MDAAIIATCLTYEERKAVRRIARGKSAQRTVAARLEEVGLAERVWGRSYGWAATRLGVAVYEYLTGEADAEMRKRLRDDSVAGLKNLGVNMSDFE